MSRKYSHRGYQDKDRKERERSRAGGGPPRQQLTSEERIQKKSLRHAIDREANAVVRCPNCGRNAPKLDVIERDTLCLGCSAPLHCCRVCRHFSPAARWQCTAPIEAAVTNKTDGNDCAHYTPTLVLDVTGRRSGSAGDPDDPKSQFDNLFKS